MTLSLRMQAVADLVSGGMTIADIGTDHAYVPIYLVQEGIVPRALAMDVRSGPLQIAAQHIAGVGLSDRIETRLSDGLTRLKEGEARSLIIAGMGGLLTIKILSEGSLLLPGIEEMILQPQSDIDAVRHYLYDHDFIITSENMVFEDGKFYPMFKAVHRPATCPEESDYREDIDFLFGKLLRLRKNPVLKQYLEGLRQRSEKIKAQLETADTQKSRQRIEELDTLLGQIDEVMKAY